MYCIEYIEHCCAMTFRILMGIRQGIYNPLHIYIGNLKILYCFSGLCVNKMYIVSPYFKVGFYSYLPMKVLYSVLQCIFQELSFPNTACFSALGLITCIC